MEELILLTLDGVKGGDTGFPVQIVLDGETRTLQLRSINEGGYACADVDFYDLLRFLESIAPGAIDADAVIAAVRARSIDH